MDLSTDDLGLIIVGLQMLMGEVERSGGDPFVLEEIESLEGALSMEFDARREEEQRAEEAEDYYPPVSSY